MHKHKPLSAYSSWNTQASEFTGRCNRNDILPLDYMTNWRETAPQLAMNCKMLTSPKFVCFNELLLHGEIDKDARS